MLTLVHNLRNVFLITCEEIWSFPSASKWPNIRMNDGGICSGIEFIARTISVDVHTVFSYPK